MINGVIGFFVGGFLGGALLKISQIKPSASNGSFCLYGGLLVGLGFGLTSLIYFFKLVFNISNFRFIVFEAALCFAFIISIRIFKKNNFPQPTASHSLQKPETNISNNFKLILIFIICSVLLGFILYALNHPYGVWDSWAMWNQKAQHLIRAFNEGRTNILNDFKVYPFDNADYPLLIPLSIARIWIYGGKEISAIPFVVNFLFLIGITLTLYGSISFLENNLCGIFSIIALLSSWDLLRMSADQMADVPLSFFFLGVLVLFVLKDNLEEDRMKRNYLMMAGVFSALAAWTKNEGLVFFFCVILAQLIVLFFKKRYLKGIREILWFVCGALPILGIIVLFKVNYGQQNDLIANISFSRVLECILDPIRYWSILKSFSVEFIKLNKGLVVILPLLIILFKKSENPLNPGSGQFIFLTFLLIGCGFFFVYLITPHDLEWHLATSMRRLILQLYPSIIFIVFSQVSIPENSIPGWLRK